jgi:hypothetical protein
MNRRNISKAILASAAGTALLTGVRRPKVALHHVIQPPLQRAMRALPLRRALGFASDSVIR